MDTNGRRVGIRRLFPMTGRVPTVALFERVDLSCPSLPIRRLPCIKAYVRLPIDDAILGYGRPAPID